MTCADARVTEALRLLTEPERVEGSEVQGRARWCIGGGGFASGLVMRDGAMGPPR